MKPRDPEKVRMIYRATLVLVRAQGLTGLTMAAIGKEAGIGMGTLYTYFESKEALINSLFVALKGQHTARIFAGLDLTEPYLVTFRKVYHNYISNRVEHYEEHVFVEQAHNSHFLEPESAALSVAAYAEIFALLDLGKSEMLIKPLPNALLAAQLVGACNALADIVAEGGAALDEAFLEAGFSMCWDSVKR